MRTLQHIKLADNKFLREINRRAANDSLRPRKPMSYWQNDRKKRRVLDGALHFAALIVFMIGVIVTMNFAVNFLITLK